MGRRCTRGAVWSPPLMLDACGCPIGVLRGWAVTRGVVTVDRALRLRAAFSEQTGSHAPAPRCGCLPTEVSSEEAVMQYGSTVLAAEPVNGVTCGIDWARDDHAAAIVDAGGREVHRSTIEHSSAGLRTLVELLTHTGVAEVAIERPDGPVVDALLGAGITVVVISPHQLKNLRSRYGSAGNKDDRFDAFVLADTLRTDRARLRRYLLNDFPEVFVAVSGLHRLLSPPGPNGLWNFSFFRERAASAACAIRDPTS
jgi:Transposase